MSAVLRATSARRPLRLRAGFAALVLVVAGCGGDDDPALSGAPTTADDAASGEAQDEVAVDMTDALTFSPEQVTIEAGGTVTWENASSVVHTATGDPDKVADSDNVVLPDGAEPWDSGFVQPGGSFSQSFTEPGTYEYVCIPHEGAGMKGSIVVEA